MRISYDREWHDGGAKRVLGKVGRFDWQDVLHLCVHHPAHAPFMVGKLWDFFAGVPLRGSTRAHLVRVYRRSGYRIRPVVGRDPRAARRSTGTSTRPTWSSRRSSTWPARCAASGQGIDRDDWTWLLEAMGQYPFRPALGGGLGVGHELAVLELDARALRLRQLHARHPPRRA